MYIFTGGASLDLNAVAPKPFRWVLDITWLNLVELNKLSVFSNLLNKVNNFFDKRTLFSNYGLYIILSRLNKMKKNGEFGMKKKNPRKKIYHVGIINLWTCSVNFYLSGRGVQIEHCHSHGNILWVKSSKTFNNNETLALCFYRFVRTRIW